MKNKLNPPKYICITGLDGSGKTTAIDEVINIINNKKSYKVYKISIWDIFNNSQFSKVFTVKNKSIVDEYLQKLSPLARTFFLFHCLGQAIHMANQVEADFYLIDSYWYKYYATEIAHGISPKKIDPVIKNFPKCDLVFYLNISPAKAYSRKKRVSKYEVGFKTDNIQENYMLFQEKVREIFNDLKRKNKWVSLNGSKPEKDLAKQIVKKINIYLRNIK